MGEVMANRIITAAVTGETIKLSNKTAGAAGQAITAEKLNLLVTLANNL